MSDDAPRCEYCGDCICCGCNCPEQKRDGELRKARCEAEEEAERLLVKKFEKEYKEIFNKIFSQKEKEILERYKRLTKKIFER